MNDALDDRTSTLLTAVEQQLTRYFASISRQVDTQKAVTTESLEEQRRANEEYQEALRAALEERLTAFAQHQHERLVAIEDQVDEFTARPAAVADTGGLVSRLDATERQLVDRLVELEHRISDEQGRRIAELEAMVGRMGAGFDEAVAALSQRLLDLDNRVADLTLRTDDLAATTNTIDPAEIDTLRTLASSAANDSALIRIELDRLTSTATKHFDHQASRLADIEQTLSEHGDVTAAVQLERLDEIERQLLALDPANSPRLAVVAPSAPVDEALAHFDTGSDTGSDTGFDDEAVIEPAPARPVLGLPEPIIHTESADAEWPSFDAEPAVDTWPTVDPEPSIDQAPTGQIDQIVAAAPAVAPVVDLAPPSVVEPLPAPAVEPAAATPAAEADPTAEIVRPTLTRRMAAPPPMTLVPRLPSARPVAEADAAPPQGMA